MNNLLFWNKEYKKNKLMTGNKPQKSFLKFLSFIKKNKKKTIENNKINILDLGSGNGKNSIYLAKKGFNVWGVEFSKDGVLLANNHKKETAKEIKLNDGSLNFLNNSFGEKLDFPNNYFDIILDITSSNSLNKKERNIYLKESSRVLKEDGFFFVRGLLKDGDKNAKYMLKNFPSDEKDAYIIPEFKLKEKVFSKNDLFSLYKKYFKIIKFLKETHYTTFGNKKYKRNFWILYLIKK